MAPFINEEYFDYLLESDFDRLVKETERER